MWEMRNCQEIISDYEMNISNVFYLIECCPALETRKCSVKKKEYGGGGENER